MEKQCTSLKCDKTKMQMMQVAPSHTQKKAKECNEENIKPHTIKKIKKMYI
jgi:hypothetical protein